MTKKINLDFFCWLCHAASSVHELIVSTIELLMVDAGSSIRKQMMKKHRDTTTSDEVWKLQCSNNGYHFVE